MAKKGFTIIPNSIIKGGKRLTDAEFRLYCTISSYDFQKGHSFPGRKTLAKEMGASVAKIDRVKKKLEEKGGIKKKRRGQGITNMYYLNQFFLSEADDSSAVVAEPSQVIGKQNESNNTFNNYLKTSLPYKETTLGGDSQPSSKSRATGKNPEVVFLSHLNRIKAELDAELSKVSDDSLREAEVSRNTTACVDGIIYYLRSYKVSYGKNHPFYKPPQLKDCMKGFLYGIWEIEERFFPVKETIEKAIDHWFSTSPDDDNLQKLSVFVGNGSSVFFRSIEAVTIRKRKGGLDARNVL